MNGREIRLLLSLIALMFLPSIFYVVTAGLPMSSGVLTACFFIYFLVLSDFLIKIKCIQAVLIIFAFIIIYQLLTFAVGNYPFDLKTIASALFLCFFISIAFLFGAFVNRLSAYEFRSVLSKVAILVVALGAFSVMFEQELLGYGEYKKSVFPFSEPSHFAITVGPLLFAAGFFCSFIFRFFVMLSFILLGMLFPSLVTLLFGGLMLVFFFQISWRLKAIYCLVLAYPSFLLFSSEFLDYFSQRLAFSSENQNLTALVYMQGWIDTWASLKHSYFLGVGLQNAGILPPSEIGNLIFSLSGEFKNRKDGGFLLAKLVSEFGLLGIILISFYLFSLFSAICVLIRLKGSVYIDEFPASIIFSSAIVVGFSVELFARGYGYFSPGLFLLVSSVFVFSGAYGQSREKGAG